MSKDILSSWAHLVTTLLFTSELYWRSGTTINAPVDSDQEPYAGTDWVEASLQKLVYEIGKQNVPLVANILRESCWFFFFNFWMLVCEFELPILSVSSFILSHDWKVICLLACVLKLILIKISLKSSRKKKEREMTWWKNVLFWWQDV